VGQTAYQVASQADLCRACHGEAAAGIVAGLTKHATVSEDTSVALAGEAGSACAKCHDPHTGTVGASGDALCLECHAAAGLSYPAGYSFRGQAAYSESSHAGLTSANGFRTLSYDSAGFGVWESADTTPTPESPGAAISSDEASRVVLIDDSLLATEIQAVPGERNYQLYRFHVDVAAGDLRTMRVQWAGLGASGVLLSVWSPETDSWEFLRGYSPTDGRFKEVEILNPQSVLLDSDVWLLVDAEYAPDSGTGPALATDYVGLALGYTGTASSSSCTVCHSMHGGSVEGSVANGQVVASEGRLCTGDGGTGCHGVDAAGAGATTDIVSKLAGASDDPRTSHDLMPEAQQATGAKIKCSDCHNPHADNATAPYADPRDISIPASVGLDAVVDLEGNAYVLIGAKHDGIGPVISNVASDTVGPRALAPLLTWTTDEKATTWVEWGTTPAYGNSAGSDALVTAHSASMSGLVVGETYHYRIRSVDALGNESATADAVYATSALPPTTPTMNPVPVPPESEGEGPLYFTASCVPVVSGDGDAAEYQFDMQKYLFSTASWGTHTLSGWLSSPSWNAQTTLYEYGRFRVLVRARDAAHPDAVSLWSTPSNEFIYTDVWAYEAYSLAPDLVMVLPTATQPAALEQATASEAPSVTSWLAGHEPVDYYTPGLYSVDSNYLSLAVQMKDGTVTYLAPVEGWESASSAENTPTPSAPGATDAVDAATLSQASAADAQWWQTSLATSDGEYNWQLARFDVSEITVGSVRQITFFWRGHGEPTPGYETVVQTWNTQSESWSLVRADLLPTDVDVSRSTSSGDLTTVCLACHGGIPPEGVVLPTGMSSLAPWSSAVGDFHGARAGIGFGSAAVKTPYTRSSGGIECTICHDAHGTGNVYHIPSVVNGRGGIVATDGDELMTVCISCHEGSVDNWHAPCVSCHLESSHWVASQDLNRLTSLLPSASSDCTECHGHGRSWTHPATCLRCHGEAELDALNATPDAPWTYGRTF